MRTIEPRALLPVLAAVCLAALVFTKGKMGREDVPAAAAGAVGSESAVQPVSSRARDSASDLSGGKEAVHRVTPPRRTGRARPLLTEGRDAGSNDAATFQLEPDLQYPFARDALNLVGAAPAANEYWLGAINDPNLPADERSGLIVDLTQAGLSDPPSPDDLPVIANRLSLLENLVENPLDDTNAEALIEAYKDLGAIFDQLTEN